MKIKFILITCFFLFSCKNEKTPNQEIQLQIKETSNCDKYDSYLSSIPLFTASKQKISLDIVKCKLFENINISKYNYAEIFSKYNYKEYSIYLYRLNCTAGGECGDYYLSIIDTKSRIIDARLIVSEMAEEEKNITVNDFQFIDGKLSFNVLSEYYDEEKDRYVENLENKNYVITDLGELQELHEKSGIQ